MTKYEKRFILNLTLFIVIVLCISTIVCLIRANNNTTKIEEYTDPETGVCYLIYSDYVRKISGITVRSNADGSIMTKEIEE